MYARYFAGLDLGQQQDFTALAVLEQTFAPDPEKKGASVRHYACRHLERFPLGTPYPALVPRLRRLVSAGRLRGCTLVVDQTGVGRAVVDVLRAARLLVPVCAVTITGGYAVTGAADGSTHVPKQELVGTLQVLLQSRRLKIAQALAEARTLEQELANFRVKITAALNETFGAWREGQHDDLVLAVALAAWRGEREPVGGLPYVLGTGVQVPRPY
jgi:hypothetical protein